MAVANKIPALNLTRISTSVYNSKKQIGLTNQVLSNRVKSIQESVDNQKRLISESNLYYRRREEIDEKNKHEAALEAPDTVKTINANNQQSLSSPSDKGFLGRLLGFAGYLAAGWILTRLPQLIKFGEDFLIRLQTAKDIVGNYGVTSFPTHIVIDKNSTILFNVSGLGPTTIDDLDNIINTLVN